MDKLGQLSEIHAKVVGMILNDQDLCKYLYYHENNPLDQPNLELPQKGMFMTKIFPYPPDQTIGDEDKIEIRVYYPVIDIQATTEKSKLFFDIVLSGSPDIWLIDVDGNNKLRPLVIMSRLLQLLHGVDIGYASMLDFKKANLYSVNGKYSTYTLAAEILSVNSGRK